jgi:hypothetical protein
MLRSIRGTLVGCSTPLLPENGGIPILFWIAEPIPISCRFEFGQLPHVDAITMAQREKLSKIIFSRPPLEFDNQTLLTLTHITFYAGDA